MKSGFFSHTARILCVSGLLAASALFADENNLTVQRKPNALSVRFSNLTGYGVAYQRNFLDNYYIRTTAWFKYYEYIKGEVSISPYTKRTDKNYNFGLDLQRNIISENRYRVFGFIGGGYAVREKMEQQDDIVNPNNFTQKLLTSGVGGGVEYYLSSKLSADFGLSYKFDYDVKEKLQRESTKETGLGAMVGLNLNF